MDTITFCESRRKLLPTALFWLVVALPLTSILAMVLNDLVAGRSFHPGDGLGDGVGLAIVVTLAGGCWGTVVRSWWRLACPGRVDLSAGQLRTSVLGRERVFPWPSLGEPSLRITRSSRELHSWVEVARAGGAASLSFDTRYYTIDAKGLHDAMAQARHGHLMALPPQPVSFLHLWCLTPLLCCALWSELSFMAGLAAIFTRHG